MGFSQEIKDAIFLVEKLGGIERTKKLAASYIKKAKKYLKPVPESKYKNLLMSWANFMTERRI